MHAGGVMGLRPEFPMQREPVCRNSLPIRSTDSDWRTANFLVGDKEESGSKCKGINAMQKSQDAIRVTNMENAFIWKLTEVTKDYASKKAREVVNDPVIEAISLQKMTEGKGLSSEGDHITASQSKEDVIDTM